LTGRLGCKIQVLWARLGVNGVLIDRPGETSVDFIGAFGLIPVLLTLFPADSVLFGCHRLSLQSECEAGPR